MPIIIAAEIIGGLILCIASYFAITSLNNLVLHNAIGGGEDILLCGAYLLLMAAVVILGNGLWRLIELITNKNKTGEEPDNLAIPVPEQKDVLPWEDMNKKNQSTESYQAPQIHYAQAPVTGAEYRANQIAAIRSAIYARRYPDAANLVNLLISQGHYDAEIIELQNYISRQINQI